MSQPPSLLHFVWHGAFVFVVKDMGMVETVDEHPAQQARNTSEAESGRRGQEGPGAHGGAE